MSDVLKEEQAKKYSKKTKLFVGLCFILFVAALASGFIWGALTFYRFEKGRQTNTKKLWISQPTSIEANFAKTKPVEGSLTEYGIPLREKSIELLTYYNYDIQLDSAQKILLENALDIISPCCGGKVKDCECNHDLALKGLAKILISERGYTAEKTREEAIFWQRYFFPAYFAQLEGRETKGSC